MALPPPHQVPRAFEPGPGPRSEGCRGHHSVSKAAKAFSQRHFFARQERVIRPESLGALHKAVTNSCQRVASDVQ
eukprot:10632875-Lingulodinium_polyedra.AAC.1